MTIPFTHRCPRSLDGHQVRDAGRAHRSSIRRESLVSDRNEFTTRINPRSVPPAIPIRAAAPAASIIDADRWPIVISRGVVVGRGVVDGSRIVAGVVAVVCGIPRVVSVVGIRCRHAANPKPVSRRVEIRTLLFLIRPPRVVARDNPRETSNNTTLLPPILFRWRSIKRQNADARIAAAMAERAPVPLRCGHGPRRCAVELAASSEYDHLVMMGCRSRRNFSVEPDEASVGCGEARRALVFR